MIPDKKKIQISITITDDKEIQALNKQFRQKDYPTDVLSFNINEEGEDGSFYLGDIVVNKQQAQRQCHEFGNTVEEELSELAAHGILHLLGIHHDGDDH